MGFFVLNGFLEMRNLIKLLEFILFSYWCDPSLRQGDKEHINYYTKLNSYCILRDFKCVVVWCYDLIIGFSICVCWIEKG